jgi:hypothetical protein
MEEWSGATAFDATGAKRHGKYEAGIARSLDGPPSPMFSGADRINRCPHFAGGRLNATLKKLKETYSVELWFWSGLPETLRPVTGYLFARGGESLAIGGKDSAPGKLVFGTLVGRTAIAPKTWNHVALVRKSGDVAVFLNGNLEPEISGNIESPAASGLAKQVFIGGRADQEATFEGRIDEVALYGRALNPEEIAAHFNASGLSAPAIANANP